MHSFLIGEVAWHLYSEKIPVDLMTLICDERNLTIDWDGFELAKQRDLVHIQYWVNEL